MGSQSGRLLSSPEKWSEAGVKPYLGSARTTAEDSAPSQMRWDNPDAHRNREEHYERP